MSLYVKISYINIIDNTVRFEKRGEDNKLTWPGTKDAWRYIVDRYMVLGRK